MKNIARKLEYYGFDDDNTMCKSKNYPMDTISKAKERKNKKYIRDNE